MVRFVFDLTGITHFSNLFCGLIERDFREGDTTPPVIPASAGIQASQNRKGTALPRRGSD